MSVSHWTTTMIGPSGELTSLCVLHSIFLSSWVREDVGKKTKQCTLDALHACRGLLLGMLYVVGEYHS
jgi:hypothetical protein